MSTSIVRSGTFSFGDLLNLPVESLTTPELVEVAAMCKLAEAGLQDQIAACRQRLIVTAPAEGTFKGSTYTLVEDQATVKVTFPKDKVTTSEGAVKELLNAKDIKLESVYDEEFTIKVTVTKDYGDRLHERVLEALDGLVASIKRKDVLRAERLEGLVALGVINADELEACVTSTPATPRLSIKVDDSYQPDLLIGDPRG